ncbi:MAG: 3'(2'),5'-bisphosphate nucleotidase CysQ [Crocinitomicaceae bacterium]|nr:3'(2'),5'-bisphosphate nucleotidase CysQ [Crocinitomicaceae bacterium]
MQITNDLVELMLQSVYDASEQIMKVYATDFASEKKSDQTPVTIADKNSSKVICKKLAQTKILIISEEEKIPEDKIRLSSEAVFLIDPLDGTKEFIRKNGEFSINIAIVKNQEPVFGMIASPVKQEIIFGGPSFGVFQTPYFEKKFADQKFRVKRLRDKKSKGLIFSRSHFTPDVNALISKLEERYGTLKLVRKGSALKFFDLARGQVDFYPRMAPTMEWDIAAGHAIYRAVGGEVLDFTTFEPLIYNKPNLKNPPFIAKPVALRID